MLKELFMALEMIKAAKDLQSEVGTLKAIYRDINEEKGTNKVTVCGENYYVVFDRKDPEYTTICEDTRIIWNSCIELRGGLNWETCVDTKGVEYEMASKKVGNVWFVTTVY